MHVIAYNQILILVLQCIIAGGLMLTLFRLRSIFGLSLFYIALGLFKFMHHFFTQSFAIEVYSGVYISIGSTVMYSAILFSILLIYIKEDAIEARKVIYALMIFNFFFAFLMRVTEFGFGETGFINRYNIPHNFFDINIVPLIIGTIVLFIDGIVLIMLYEALSKKITSLFFKIFLTTGIVLFLNVTIFSIASLFSTTGFSKAFLGGFVSKIIAVPTYSILFWLYLVFIEKEKSKIKIESQPYSDIFSTLTFRQKFEKVSIEKEKMEHELSETENYLQTIFDATTDAIFIHDGETGEILDVNQQMCDQFGYTKEEVMQNDLQSLSSDIYPYTKEEANKWLQKVKNEGTQTFEWQARHKDGHVFWVEVSVRFIEINGENRFIATSRNIEKRKEVENKLNKSNRLFEIISQMNMAVINIRNQKMLLEKFCDIIIEIGKFKLAWIGFINTEKQSISPYASAGDGVNYLNNFKIDLTDKVQSKGPTALAISNKNSVVFNDIENTPSFKFWYKKAEKYDFKSVVSIPIIVKNKVIGNINIYDSEVLFFDVDEIELLEKTSLIISLALQKINEEIIRKQAEAALQKSENRYRYFVEQTSEGFYQMASEKPIPLTLPMSQQINWMYKYMYVTECNDVFAKLYGYKKADNIIGKRLIELHGNAKNTENRNTITSFIKSNYKVINALTNEINKQGEVRYFTNNAVGIIENNCLVAFWGTQLDVTPQKKIEAKLQESYKIINRSPAVMFLWKKEEGWPVSYVSENVEKLTEYSVNDFLTHKISYYNIIHKEDLEMVTNEVATFSKNEEATSFSHKPYRIITKSGKIKWVNDNSVIRRNENNEITHFEGLVIDITERILLQKTLQNYANRLKILHNLDKEILAAMTPQSIANNVFPKLKKIIPFKLASLRAYNPKTQKIITIATSFELPLNSKVKAEEIPISEFDFIDIEDLMSGNMQILKNLKNIKSKSFIIEELIKNNINIIVIIPLMAEGEYIGALNLSAQSITSFSSEMIETAKEIANQLAISLQQCKLREEILTYTKELEGKVEERTKELAHSNRELRDFAQIVSHDLKAPLRAISQLSYWLSKDYADKIDEEGQKQLNLLIGRVQRLDNLIEGILRFSRIGRVKEKEVKINLNKLVKDTIELLNPPENIRVIIDNKFPEIMADPTRIGQLFQNLIQNAIKFMDKPTGFINIGVSEKDKFYEFYVKDNGCGISEEYFDRIFKIFQRLVSRDEQEGTGIGLSLVKRIAQIYGGDVWLTSKVGKGSTFYFTILKN